jgi:integrase
MKTESASSAPMDYLRRKPGPVKALTPAQRDQLDEFLLGLIPGHSRSALVIRVLLWTGLRVSEALALKPWDFDDDTRELRVATSKTAAGAGRFVDVPDCVVADVRRLAHLSFEDRPHPTTLRRHLKRACELAKLPQIRVHDLRHTRITTQLLAGVPVGYVSKQAGHATPGFTLKTYDHWIQVASREQRRAWTNS